jgi:subtilisin-like proprotein convertase family protein
MPFLHAQPMESWTFTTNRLVPDGNAAGISDVRSVSSTIGAIASLQVRLKITGEFNGDLYAYLRHSSGYVVLLNRPGKTAADTNGYADNGFNVTFQNGAANGDIHLCQDVGPPAAGSPLTGIWQPDGRADDPTNVTDTCARVTSLTNFNGLAASGDWTLYVSDVASGGTNLLAEWGLDITGAAYPPPVAGTMTVTRTAGLALLIAWSDVATNWSDPESSPVTLAGINLVTTNQVTLATNSAWILYPKGPNVSDQFSYSIRDGLGGTNIGFVNVVIQSSVTGTNSITKIVAGNPTILTAYGIPGYSYITERATNLAPLLWVDIATNIAAANGLIIVPDYFSDLGSNAPASAYYQLKWQP